MLASLCSFWTSIISNPSGFEGLQDLSLGSLESQSMKNVCHFWILSKQDLTLVFKSASEVCLDHGKNCGRGCICGNGRGVA